MGIRTGDAFASGTSLASRDFMEDTNKKNKYKRDNRTKVGREKASYEVYNTSPLTLTSLTSGRPVMSTVCGLLGSRNGCQFTPYPVPTAATTSTVTITTSPVSTTNQKWEQHYKLWVPAPQGGRRDPLGNGPATIQTATLPGQPFNFS